MAAAPVILALLLACGASSPRAEPRIPAEPGAFAPSQLALDADTPLTAAQLADVGACAGCHPTQANEWSSSAHAIASFDNPWYRVSVDALREDAGDQATRHCGGCHDPALLLAGRMDQAVQPHDPLAVVGVACLACHGATAATSTGTGSLTLSGDVPLPRDGDDASLAAHKAAMGRETLRSPALCVSCHRGILAPETGNPDRLVGQDDAGGWRTSAWAGSAANVLEAPIPARDCADCHMAAMGDHHSHRAPGGQTALAGALGDDAQLAAMQDLLKQAATLGIGLWADGALVSPAELSATTRTLAIDAVVRNTGAGHTLPGGPRDTQDLWLALTVRTATGRTLAEIGARPDDPQAWRLDAGALREDGSREREHRTALIRASAWDHGVPARQARAFRTTIALTELAAEDWPLSVELRLRHRRHAATLQAAACADHDSPRGAAFSATSQAAGRPAMDACAAPPTTEMASLDLEIGPGAPAAPAEFLPAFEHTLALAQQLPERLDEASAALDRARPLATSPLQQAQVLWLSAIIAGRQGRADDAFTAITQAEALVGPQAALARAAGRAGVAAWRWQEALPWLERTAALAPNDSVAWRELATALGSLQRPEDALRAATRGLALAPHDADLLRAQALALEALADPRAPEARAAWLGFRGPDQAADLALRCEQQLPGCAAARQPVPEGPPDAPGS